MKAKEYLLQIRKYDNLIHNRIDEINRLKEQAKTPGGNLKYDTKVQTTRKIDVMQDTIVDYVELENRLKEEIDRYWDKRTEIIHSIEKLKAVEYDFLHKAYVQGKNFQEIADDYDRSYSWATTIHARALKSLQAVLDAAE